MKILAAICLLAVGASAQVGPSGIISPDGKNIQFTHDQANNIAVVGPSGIVTKDGKNLQLTHGQATLNAAIPTPAAPSVPLPPTLAGVVGASGIVHPAGNTQFTREQAENIVLIGPSGIVTKDGRNIQLRSKRSTLIGPSAMFWNGVPIQFSQAEGQLRSTLTPDQYSRAVVVGPSGAVALDGNNIQFAAPDAVTVLLDGPSGTVMSDGTLVQKRAKRSLIGPSGMLWNGVPVQFSHAEGQLRSKLTPDQYSRAVVVGPSGAVALDGKNIQFAAPAAVTVLLDGPSGTVMSDGTLVQKRAKRSLIGPSGMIRADGTPVQFTQAEGEVRATLTAEQNARAVVVGPSGIVNVDGMNTQFDAPAVPHVILDGPSGQVLSDGSLVQKIVKRSLPLVGPSGIILADGTPIHLPAGVTIASAGPSGVVLSNGQNIQFS